VSLEGARTTEATRGSGGGSGGGRRDEKQPGPRPRSALAVSVAAATRPHPGQARASALERAGTLELQPGGVPRGGGAAKRAWAMQPGSMGRCSRRESRPRRFADVDDKTLC